MKIATDNEKIIIEKLVHFKDYIFIRSVISMLKSEEDRKKLIKWLDNHPDCSKTDVDIAVINIVY